MALSRHFEPQSVRPVVKYMLYLSPAEKWHAIRQQLLSTCDVPIRWNDFFFVPSADLCDLVELIFRGQWSSTVKEKFSFVWFEFSVSWCFMLANLDGILPQPAPGRLGSVVIVSGVVLAGGSGSGRPPALSTANTQLSAWTTIKPHSLLRCQMW